MDEKTQKGIYELGLAIKNLCLIDSVIDRTEAKLEGMLISRDKLRDKIGGKLFASAEYRALELQKKGLCPEPELYTELDPYFITGKVEKELDAIDDNDWL